MKLTPELEDTLHADGYLCLREIDGKICGLMKFAYTVGLIVDITMENVFGKEYSTYQFRYCYPYEKTREAVADLLVYKYLVDPIGGWVKQKGGIIDRVNPAIEDEWINNRK